MPLVVVVGLPSVGKTRVATALAAHLRAIQPHPVVVVNEESHHIQRAEGYRDATSEKITRGSLKAGVDHALNARTIVIIDSLNYIKGYRYELYCSARTESTQYCMVWVEADKDQARSWNSQRGEGGYPADMLEELYQRFEPPDSRNRWDRPLVRVTNSPSAHEEGEGKVEGQLDEDDASLVAACTEVAEVLLKGRAPTAPLSCKTPHHAQANDLFELDRVTQRVVSHLLSKLQDGTAGPGQAVQVCQPDATRAVLIPLQRPSIAEVRRLRRQFLKSASDQLSGGTAREVADAFVDYINEHLS